MAQASTEPREMDFKNIIMHLEALEETDTEQNYSDDKSENRRTLSCKNEKGRCNKKTTIWFTPNTKAGNNNSGSISSNKSCGLYRLFKGEEISARKTQHEELYVQELLQK